MEDEPTISLEDARNGRLDVPQLFALLRQWDPDVQAAAPEIIHRILERGVGINDRDKVSDMTLLHFASKAGANGIGSQREAANLARELINRGANVNIRSKWTDMTPLLMAAFFGCSATIEVLVNEGKADLHARSSEFESGTPLHLATSAGSLATVKVLLALGANVRERDDQNRTPIDCAKLLASSGSSETDADEWKEIISTLVDNLDATEHNPILPKPQSIQPAPIQAVQSAAGVSSPRGRPVAIRAAANTSPIDATKIEAERPFVNSHANLQIAAPLPNVGDRVVVKGSPGVVRYRGPTRFESGEWLGVELDAPIGKHNGTIAGTSYFSCAPKHGLFLAATNASALNAELEVIPSPTKPNSSIRSETLILSPKTAKQPTIAPRTPLSKVTKAASAIPTLSPSKPANSISSAPQEPPSTPLSATFKLQTAPITPKTPLTPSTPPSVSQRANVSSAVTPRTPVAKAVSGIPRKTTGKDELAVGDILIIQGSGAGGTLRFIGQTEFADGIWLGVELYEPVGKNNGSVEGHKYFSCADRHGLFVRPNKATRRGINCATFFPTQ